MTPVEFEEERRGGSNRPAPQKMTIRQFIKRFPVTVVFVCLVIIAGIVYFAWNQYKQNTIIPYQNLPASVKNKFPLSVQALYDNN